jgi:hypothetical protein
MEKVIDFVKEFGMSLTSVFEVVLNNKYGP